MNKKDFEDAFMASDLLSFSFVHCSGLLQVTPLDVLKSGSATDMHIRQYFAYVTGKGLSKENQNLQVDLNYPVTFYKKQGRDFIAWRIYEQGRWITVNIEKRLIKRELI